ncbi:MAG: multidrug ABC transporter ATP-binding protein [Planctomycetota bacterium]|nr:MAG: multidrug ABC transporter ATP-binding protein [Planctomycetota bacterium]
MSAPLLEVDGLSKSFDGVRAVDGLSFALERGRITAFIGPNGAGKTTTMRIAATLEIPDRGDVRIEGISVLEEPQQARLRLGFMADQFVPYADLDVEQYLQFFAHAYGLRGLARRRTVASVIEFCGLGDMLRRPTTGLSKGMGQRLHLAKTLLHDPPLLLLDEPAAGLDPRARIELRELLRELAAAGKGVLISSHILAELSEIADALVLIEAGRLVLAGTTAEAQRAVREHHLIRMRVLEDNRRAERWLLTQPQVREVKVLDEVHLQFDFTGDERAMAELLRRAVEAGLGVVSFATEEADLEEVFMRTTRGVLQ